MSGAVSFVLGLLGLGAAGGVNVGQSISENKRVSQVPGIDVWDADTETNKMRERVYKEWMNLGSINCLGKWPSEYPTGRYQHSQRRNWFRAHLEAKGIPYDDEILDEVTGINGERSRMRMIDDARRRARNKWF